MQSNLHNYTGAFMTTQLELDIEHLMTLMSGTPAPLPPPKVKALNAKAMSVQLITCRPTTRHNDEEAAKVARGALGDEGISASTQLFRDNTSPIKMLLSEVGAAYQYHKKSTLPYIDRGPRLLPVTRYESYRDEMRVLIGDVHRKVSVYKNDPAKYDQAVTNDIAYRNAVAVSRGSTGRALVSDYPTARDFTDAIDLTFTFAPLPDNSHWLFDVDEEDRASLDTFAASVLAAAAADLKASIEVPLRELITTLNTSPGIDKVTGKRIGIFRDTKVTNLTEAVERARSLCMDDEQVLAACDLVDAALPSVVRGNIDVLRESPVVREQQAQKLADVQNKMAAFFGGN